MCGTIQRTLSNKTRKDTMMRFYKVLAVPLLTYGNIKVQWLQHIDRMDPERLTKQVLHYTPTGRRSVGRPMCRWKDSL
ncbi:hypothetical protein C0J52_16335 [Blattella germanica]|nr:hypothetical protein C0J52_16335 [Blattella germanica]